MPNSRTIPYLEAIFAVVVWGASFIATKVALRYISPVSIVWLRFAMGVVILGIVVALRRQFAWPNRRDLPYFALLGFLAITFHQWLQSNALQTSEAGTTAWIVSTSPVFMALLGWLILKENVSGVMLLGIVLAFAGVLMVVYDGNLAEFSLSRFGEPGDVLVLISAVNWAVVSVLSRRGLKSHPASLMMLYLMAFGWLFTSVLYFASESLSTIGSLTADGWLAIAFLGIFCSGLAYIAWYDALQALTTAQTGVFLYLEPLVAVVVAFFILGEAVTPASLLGGGIIILGVWLVNR
jgi:drug/metabolite transporter (DMT)-like permease